MTVGTYKEQIERTSQVKDEKFDLLRHRAVW